MARKLTNREKVENAFKTLRAGVIELLNNPNQMEAFFQQYGRNYHYNIYSSRNTMILMFETMLRKGAMFQMARGYKAWKKDYNRTVKKGEKAMYILAPQKRIIEKYIDEETGEEVKKYQHYYKSVPVFELSQTEGDPVPRNCNKNHLYKIAAEYNVEDFISKVNVPVEFEELLEANGYTDGKRIAIGKHNNDLAAICTLFHELAHLHLHYDRGEELEVYSKSERRNLKELEAETVSFMVSAALGIENNYSKEYIANWNDDEEDIDEEFEKRSYNLLMEALNQIDLFIGEEEV